MTDRRQDAHAFGKVILLGEHAAVYGYPAIAAGIEPGVTARCHARGGAGAELSIQPWQLTVRTGDAEALQGTHALLHRAFEALVENLGAPAVGVRVEAEAHLPPGGGLGSSAALGVAVARAIVPEAPLARIDEAVATFEAVFHGNASGLDAAVAARGGLQYFRKTSTGITTETIVPKRRVQLCIGHSGPGASTRTMVEGVARQRERNPAATDRTLVGIGELVKTARIALEDGDLDGLGKLLDLNQILLASLMVSTPDLERMCQLARAAGALGAKLTGAGGGGAVVALVPEEPERVLAAWNEAGFRGLTTAIPPAVRTFGVGEPSEIS